MPAGVLTFAIALVDFYFVKMLSQRDCCVCTPAFLAADAIVSQGLHAGLISRNTRDKRTDLRFFGSGENSFGLIKRIFHTAALPALLQFDASSDFSQGRCSLRRQILQNVRSFAHNLTPQIFPTP